MTHDIVETLQTPNIYFTQLIANKKKSNKQKKEIKKIKMVIEIENERIHI